MHFVRALAILSLCVFVELAAGIMRVSAATKHPAAADVAFKSVVSIANAFKDGGVYRSDNKGSGFASDIKLGDALIFSKDKDEQVHCVGFTFAVFTEAANERGLLKDVSRKQFESMQKLWCGVEGDTELQCVAVLSDPKVGQRVQNITDIQPGDFVQFFRKKERTDFNGHSVVVLEVIFATKANPSTDAGAPPRVKDPTRVIGLRYRSAQSSSPAGIGNRTAYFTDVKLADEKDLQGKTITRKPGDDSMQRDRTYVGRPAEGK